MATVQRPRSRSGLPDSTTATGAGAGSKGGGRPSTPSSAGKNAVVSPASRPRRSLDGSPRSVDPKPKAVKLTQKLRAPANGAAEPQPAAAPAPQEDVDALKEDLKKVRAELTEARKVADETNEKLQEALMAKRWAEEATEMEKFRADELEQSGMDDAQRRDEVWRQELDWARRELELANGAKNAALAHAEEAMKIAEFNADKVRSLSAELTCLKANAAEAGKADAVDKKLNGDLDSAGVANMQLMEMEKLIEDVRMEAGNAKRAESDARWLLDEWQRKASEADELIGKLKSENSELKGQLDDARSAEEKLTSMEKLIEDAKNAESVASQALEEWRRKAGEVGELVGKLEHENAELKGRLDDARSAKEKMVAMEKLMEDAKKAEMDAHQQLDQWQRKASEADGLVQKLEHENAELKGHLDGLLLAQDKLANMEKLMADLRAEVASAKKAETDACRALNEWRSKASEADEFNAKLESENNVLKGRLDSAQIAEEKLVVMEKLADDLRREAADAKMAESNVRQMLDEWQRKSGVADELVAKLEFENAELKGHLDGARVTEEKLKAIEELVDHLHGEAAEAKKAESNVRQLLEEWQGKANLADELVSKLVCENAELKCHLDEAQVTEEKLTATETLIDDLRADLANSKKAESDVRQLLDDWRSKAALLEVELQARACDSDKLVRKLESENVELKGSLESARIAEEKLIADADKAQSDISRALDDSRSRAALLKAELEEVKIAQKLSSESHASAKAKLEEKIVVLQAKHAEINDLRLKLEALELQIAQLTADVDEASQRRDMALQEAFELQTVVDILKNKLESSQNNELIVNGVIQSLNTEKAELIGKLDALRSELVDTKINRESLSTALAEISELKLALNNTRDSYEAMLEEANYEIVSRQKAVESLQAEVKGHRDMLGSKTVEFTSFRERAEDDIVLLRVEADKSLALLRLAEARTSAVEAEIAEADEAAATLRAENSALKARLAELEDELRTAVAQAQDTGEELRVQETDSAKVGKLCASPSDSMLARPLENGDEWLDAGGDVSDAIAAEAVHAGGDVDHPEPSTDSELVRLNGDDAVENGSKGSPQQRDSESPVKLNGDGAAENGGKGGLYSDASPQQRDGENEMPEDEVVAKRADVEGRDVANGVTAASSAAGQTTPPQKKIKPLLKKFGSLLKKKNAQKY